MFWPNNSSSFSYSSSKSFPLKLMDILFSSFETGINLSILNLFPTIIFANSEENPLLYVSITNNSSFSKSFISFLESFNNIFAIFS